MAASASWETDDETSRISHTIAAVLAAIVGLTLLTHGWRLLKPGLFCMVGALGGFFAFRLFKLEEVHLTFAWTVTICIAIGILCGIVAVRLLRLGIFFGGASLGVFGVWVITNAYLLDQLQCTSENFCWQEILVLAAGGLICGSLALSFERQLIILATSIIGSYTTIHACSYFIGKFPATLDVTLSKQQLIAIAHGKGSIRMPNTEVAWGYFASIVVLALIGAIYQLQVSGKGVHHRTKESGQQEPLLLRHTPTPTHGQPIYLVQAPNQA